MNLEEKIKERLALEKQIEDLDKGVIDAHLPLAKKAENEENEHELYRLYGKLSMFNGSDTILRAHYRVVALKESREKKCWGCHYPLSQCDCE